MKTISLTLLFFVGLNQFLFAQNINKTLNVGDFITINPCKKNQKEIESMDVYSRTTPYNKSMVDTLNGEGLFEAFFNDKSIDAKPLPCIMSGKKYKVAALNEFNVNGTLRRVVLCYTNYHLTLIWIELDQALANNQISF